MKIVLNKCDGEFALSKKACDFLEINDGSIYLDHSKRTDKKLIECVEKLGSAANGENANLQVIDFPEFLYKQWGICDCCGFEKIEEKNWGAGSGRYKYTGEYPREKHIPYEEKQIALNRCVGKFRLSERAVKMLTPHPPFEGDNNEQVQAYYNEHRTRASLLWCVFILQEKASADGSQIEIVESEDVATKFYYIKENDGIETIELYPPEIQEQKKAHKEKWEAWKNLRSKELSEYWSAIHSKDYRRGEYPRYPNEKMY